MKPEDLPTDERLIEVAERLFATKGVNATLVSDIVKDAGQRNPSALRYHFGSREGVLSAILTRYQQRLEEERGRLLANWPTPGPTDALDAVTLVGQPLVDLLGAEKGQHYLCILGQIIDRLDVDGTTNIDRYPNMVTTLDLLKRQVAHLPTPIVTERVRAVLLMMTATLAARAREFASGERPALSTSQFRDNLFTMAAAVLTAEPGPLRKDP